MPSRLKLLAAALAAVALTAACDQVRIVEREPESRIKYYWVDESTGLCFMTYFQYEHSATNVPCTEAVLKQAKEAAAKR